MVLVEPPFRAENSGLKPGTTTGTSRIECDIIHDAIHSAAGFAADSFVSPQGIAESCAGVPAALGVDPKDKSRGVCRGTRAPFAWQRPASNRWSSSPHYRGRREAYARPSLHQLIQVSPSQSHRLSPWREAGR